MLKNRSVPTDTVLPHLTYQNLEAAIAWLTRVFGFTEHYRYGNPVSGAQLHLGNAWVMVSRPGFNDSRVSVSPIQFGHHTQSLTIFVEDVDAHFAKTKNSDAKICEDLHETIYGERQYGVIDLEGHPWLFSRHAHDLSPDEWGATIVTPQ